MSISKQAAFAAGCFWGVEEIFRHQPGVTMTEVGFMGGDVKNPSYEEVGTEKTGHAETVHLTYDPEKISYDDLLKIFWENHDPTQVNRQGPDVGSQYRSAIFYYDDEQKAAAEKSRDSLNDFRKDLKFKGQIATEIVPATDFYRAEEYHQQYNEKTGKTCRS